MIRYPLRTAAAAGRTRADINRVTDGIAASLRSFSVAQRLQKDDERNDRQVQSGRQRAAAAFDELMSNYDSPRPGPTSTSTPGSGPTSQAAPARGGIITGAPLRSRGGFRGGLNIIRDGFRGRGGAPGGGGLARGGGEFSRGRGRGQGEFRGRGRGRGQGGAMGRGRDDRPRRGRGGGRGGRGGKGSGYLRKEDEEEEEVDLSPQQRLEMAKFEKYLQKMTENPDTVDKIPGEYGVTMDFDPSVSVDTLNGYGPAVPVSGSRFAASETVVRAARVLGGGQPYEETNVFLPDDIHKMYKQGEGVFCPTPDAREWTGRAIKTKLESPDEATKTAILEDTLLGKYDGPKFAEKPLDIIQNYVKRDGTWNADASRRIQEKVRSLLPGGGGKPMNSAPKEKGAKA
ncbi:hypothetical protein F5Y15DRAFT_428875 [Xylariaceae sp. FL0016]|nr:hypothetical protein F5Y15DRAFT_428875 [Xylariaceae sp. FL0016]